MGKYRRTVSFPNPISSFHSNSVPKSYHVRSVSLPCGRTHPFIPQLRGQIDEIRAWLGPADFNPTKMMTDGLSRLKSLLDSLDDVLQLPQTQDSLSSKTNLVERLLEDFLSFVDVYQVFHSSMLGFKQEISSAQVALRRKDDSKLGLYVKSHKKIATEIGKLIATVSSIAEHPVIVIQPGVAHAEYEDELAHVIQDVHHLTAKLSETLLTTVSGSFGPGHRPAWARFGFMRVKKEEERVEEFLKVIGGVEGLLKLRKKKSNDGRRQNNEDVKNKVLKRMQELEDCVGEMETKSERVFRSLISTRVSLLNILTHS